MLDAPRAPPPQPDHPLIDRARGLPAVRDRDHP